MGKENSNSKFSHIETDHLRATFIDDDSFFEKLGGEMTEDSIMISLDDGTHPAYEGAEIKLEGFSILKDSAGDHILYFKHKPEENTIICHPTLHPYSQKVLYRFRLKADKHNRHITMLETHIKDMRKILRDRYAGTLKTDPGVHPKMGYLDKKE
ncbi:MAG: hypothetical protein Q7J10_09520 [Methanosarcinaceae archaeon]|nr:hypothetical protein [Methanosarcinaceae archaeon]